MMHRISRWMRTTLAVVLLFATLCSQAMAVSMACYINANTKVYQYASTSARSLNVGKYTTATMTAFNNYWARVERQGGVAFIPIQYITLKNRLTAYISKDVPLYKKASTSSGQYGVLKRGQQVFVNGRSGNYFRIENQPGTISGYVPAAYLTGSKPATTSTPQSSSNNSLGSTVTKYYSGMSNSQKIEYVIYIAQTCYGKPYASNANPPYSFDCSRFVRHCFGQANIWLEYSAVNQGYDSRFTKINSISSLKRGDVVVFNTNSTDGDVSDHTGIYLGQGYFVHASSSAGKVIISTLSSGYYKNTFSWGLRILG